MSHHDTSFYIEVILEHIAAIKSYTPNSRQNFLDDAKTYDAVLMRLIAIGEELASVKEVLDDKDPSLEWHKIIGLRNRIAHGYWEVDKDLIWELLTDGSLDALHAALS